MLNATPQTQPSSRLARFKKAAAAKKLAASGSARISDEDIARARATAPLTFLESQGLACVKRGRYYSAEDHRGDEQYRVNEKNGIWLWCDHHGNSGGDNIALVQDFLPGTDFPDAVRALISESLPAIVTSQIVVKESTPLDVPNCSQHDIDRAVNYLHDMRKISHVIISAALESGFLRASPGYALFCGYDTQERLRMYTRRAVARSLNVQKCDGGGSDKSFVPILPGSLAEVWIVEGGVDAMALHDMRRKAAQPLPTVIVSGGAGVRSWTELPHVAELLRAARTIVVACDNEDTQETQIETDRAHDKQVQRIKAAAPGVSVTLHHPPDRYKDLADQNEAMGEQK